MKWAVLDGDYVVTAGQAKVLPVVPAGAVEVETALSVGDLARAMLVEGAYVLRPDGPEIVSIGTTYAVLGCAVDTLVEVHDLTGGEIASSFTVATPGDDVELTIADPGEYRIEVTPPLPALPVRLQVEVTA